MNVSSAEKVDYINIGLLLLSAALAMVMPFELFLFSYAILGPLHYLTEISWLHDRNYFTKGKYDGIYITVICICITIIFFNGYFHFDLEIPPNAQSNLTWIALLLAVLFVTIKSTVYRLLGVLVIAMSMVVSNWNTVMIYLTVFLPTLIHVYVFTGLFMLSGALRSKSKPGMAAVVLFVLCPVLLVFVLPGTPLYPVTTYGINAYTGGETHMGFGQLHIELMNRFMDYQVQASSAEEAQGKWLDAIFNSSQGIVIARLIAFAYTYHYLNWFSKTRVIQWHKVPKGRFVLVVVIWIISVALYIVNYTLGLVWLFCLSIMHVFLELPLNVTSIINIYKSMKQRGTRQQTAAE